MEEDACLSSPLEANLPTSEQRIIIVVEDVIAHILLASRSIPIILGQTLDLFVFIERRDIVVRVTIFLLVVRILLSRDDRSDERAGGSD